MPRSGTPGPKMFRSMSSTDQVRLELREVQHRGFPDAVRENAGDPAVVHAIDGDAHRRRAQTAALALFLSHVSRQDRQIEVRRSNVASAPRRVGPDRLDAGRAVDRCGIRFGGRQVLMREVRVVCNMDGDRQPFLR